MTESDPRQDVAPISFDALLRPCFERIKAQLSARKHAKLQEDLDSLLEKLSVFLTDSDGSKATETPVQHDENPPNDLETKKVEDDSSSREKFTDKDDETPSLDSQRKEEISEDDENRGTKTLSDSGHMHPSSLLDAGKHRKTGALPDGAALGEWQCFKDIVASRGHNIYKPVDTYRRDGWGRAIRRSFFFL
jgi:hypothetical protein